MRLEERRRKHTVTRRAVQKTDKRYAEILKLFDEVRSAFIVARHFLSMNEKPDLVSSSIMEGCIKFEKVKKLLASLEGFSADKQFQKNIKTLESEITLLKKFI